MQESFPLIDFIFSLSFHDLIARITHCEGNFIVFLSEGVLCMEYHFTYPCFCKKNKIKMSMFSHLNTTVLIRTSTFCDKCKEDCRRLNREIPLHESEHFLEKMSYEVRSYFLLHHQDNWMSLFKFPLSSSQINDVIHSFDPRSADLLMSKKLSRLELFLWLQHYPSLSTMGNILLTLNVNDTYIKLRLDIVETYFRIKGESIPLYL